MTPRLTLLETNLPVENRFVDALKRERSKVTEGEKMEEALSEPEEDIETGVTPAEKLVPVSYCPEKKIENKKVSTKIRNKDKHIFIARNFVKPGGKEGGKGI